MFIAGLFVITVLFDIRKNARALHLSVEAAKSTFKALIFTNYHFGH